MSTNQILLELSAWKARAEKAEKELKAKQDAPVEPLKGWDVGKMNEKEKKILDDWWNTEPYGWDEPDTYNGIVGVIEKIIIEHSFCPIIEFYRDKIISNRTCATDMPAEFPGVSKKDGDMSKIKIPDSYIHRPADEAIRIIENPENENYIEIPKKELAALKTDRDNWKKNHGTLRKEYKAVENEIIKLREQEVRKKLTSNNSDYAKCREAYIDGYESGHNDTVESCYGSAGEKADEWVNEHF